MRVCSSSIIYIYIYIFSYDVYVFYRKEKKTPIYKLNEFIPLHAYLCIVDEYLINTDQCKEDNPGGKSLIFREMFLLLALFTMCIIFRSIDTIFTTKFTIHH